MARNTGNELPSIVTVSDVSNPELLVRLLRDMADKVSGLNTRINSVVSAPKPGITNKDLAHIQKALQSDGSHPLNITDLQGVQGEVPPAVIPLPAVPTGLDLQTYRDSQLLLITKAPLELWVVRGGNPNTASQIV